MTAQERPWPTEVRLEPGGCTLHISFDDGTISALAAEYLRVESPSAEVQGHGRGQRKLVSGKSECFITKIEPVGNYAIRLTFDDGHDSGLFTWDYLHELGRDKQARWADYLARLTEAALSR